MDRKDFTAGINDNNRRIDKVIRKFLPETSLTDIYKAFRKGLIKVNDKKVTGDYKLSENDKISIPKFMISTNDNSIIFENKIQLPEIIFENNHFIIFNKPYDVLVQGNESSLDKIVQQWFKNSYNDNSLSFNPGPLHRLDRKTTGLITFSKSIQGAHWFSENIKNHNIHKKYFTILEGEIKKQEIWEDFIEKTSDSDAKFHKVKISANQSLENGKKAYTVVTPINIGKYNSIPITFAEIEIKTGRMHQIRSQSSLHKHPILGDIAYNGQKIDKKYTKKDFFLHAYKLYAPENNLDFPTKISINLPEDFKNFLRQTCDIEISEV